MKLLIFGGTTEGRELAEALSLCGHEVTVSVATEMGAEELTGISCRLLCGRRSSGEIAELVGEYALVIDATHPYAREISQNIRSACGERGVPLKRVCRRESSLSGEKRFPSVAAAAEYLRDQPGNVLIATGAKELDSYGCLSPERLYPRVLPTHAGLEACERLGVPHKNIIAMHGPFTKEMNVAVLRQFAIRWMVTKDGGAPGGFPEKQEAAAATGTSLLVVERPEDAGITAWQLLKELQEGFQ